MDNTPLLSGLSLFTLVMVLAALVGAYIYFLRSRKNRIATKHALGIDETKSETPRSP